MSTKIHSPFHIIQDFISPMMCEDIVYELNFTVPDVDLDHKPQKTIRSNDKAEDLIFDRIQKIIPDLEERYKIKYEGTERIIFEWYSEGCVGEPVHCENSEFLRSKWLRIKNRDLSAILFMSDFQETIPFDQDFEVYGGKLEFAQHAFGFNPERGTLIVFPSSPHFINATNQILAGDLYQARFHIAASVPFLYQPVDFPGDFASWLQEFA